MLKLRYFLYIFLISNINCESCTLNVDFSDIDSQSLEKNEIKLRHKNKNQSQQDYGLKNQDETYEQISAEKKTEKETTNKINSNDTAEISIEDYQIDNIVHEDYYNRIDDLEPTTNVAEYLNKTTVISTTEQVASTYTLQHKDGYSNNRSIALVFNAGRHGRMVQNKSRAASVSTPLRKAAKVIKDGGPEKVFFKSCRDKDKDDLCRNTLIDYPYAVSIQKKGAHYATGALLDKRWILTVAGEFYNIRESIKFFRARLGSVNCKKGGIVLPLQEVSIHPLYVPDKPGYDLGLVRLGTVVNYTDYIKPIRLTAVTDKVLSAKFLTNYWPRLIVKGQLLAQNARERTKSNSMRVSTQRLIGWQYCNKMMLEMNEHLQENSLCLKPLVTHHSLCMPDPGAPVVADDGLWGITSGWTSKLCYSLPGPTIFTRISGPLVRSWLDSQLLGI